MRSKIREEEGELEPERQRAKQEDRLKAEAAPLAV